MCRLISNLSGVGIILFAILFLPLDSPILNAQSNLKSEINIQAGHSDMVFSLAFSPDGKYAISGSQDQTLKLWDISTGKEIRTFQGHSSTIKSVAFSPNYKYALSGSGDNTMKLWDVSTGKELRTFTGHLNSVSSVEFSPDSKFVLSGSYDKTLKLWDASTGKEIRTFTSSNEISSIAFSQDGNYAFSATCGFSNNDTINVWDIATGKLVKTIAIFNNFFGVAFSSDGKFVLSGTGDKTIKLWDSSNGKLLRRFISYGTPIVSTVFSPDGKYALLASGYNVDLIDFTNAQNKRQFKSYTEKLKSEKGEDIFVHCGHSDMISSVAFSPDGKYFVSGGWGGDSGDCAILWDVASGKVIQYFTGEWDETTKKYTGHTDSVWTVAFTPDGKYVLSGSADKTMKLWDIAGGTLENKPWEIKCKYGKLIRTFSGHSENVNSVAFSADGTYILSGSADGTLKLWDVASGKELRTFTFPGHGDQLVLAVFSPDGKYILVGSGNDIDIKLLDISNGKVVKTFTGHSLIIRSIAFSPDGKYILSGSMDKTMKLWDASTGEEIKTFAGHLRSVSSVTFSPDGKYVLSGSEDNTSRIWNIKTGEWVAFMNHIAHNVWNSDNKDWIIFDSDGNWDSSRHGGDLVAMVSGMNCWNIDQFAIRNNRPDLILAKLPNPDRDLITEYYKQYKKRISKLEKLYGIKGSDLSSEMHVSKAEILKAEQKDKNLTLSIKLSDSEYNIVSYNIYINDVPVYPEIGKKINRNKKLEITETIELSTGDNKVEVSCFNEKGVESYRSLTFAYYEAKKKGNLYFIGFGVSDYKDDSINDLKYSENDVLDLANKFSSMNKDYDNINVKTYIGREVTPVNIRSAKDFVKNAGVDDTVVLFISGHGMHDSDEYRTYYYLTQNTDMTNLKGTAADFETVEDILAGINPRKKMFLMDTCDSGELDDFAGGKAVVYENKGGKGNPRTPKGIVVEYTDKRGYFDKSRYIYNDLFRRTGAVVFSSSMGGEASWEFDVLKNGAFTEAILEGLSGKADIDKNGAVAVDELRDYVSKSVDEYTEGKQHPVIDRDNIYMKFELPVR